MLKAITIFLSLFLTGQAWAQNPYNMPVGVTPVSREIHSLHMTIFWICVAIAVVVFGVMLYSIIMHRKSRGAKPAQFHESTFVEIIWTVIPFAILVAMAVPATKVLVKMYDSSESELTVLVTGYQWKWKYDYLDAGVGFFSNLATKQAEITNQYPKQENYLLEVDNPLVLPVGKKIRILTTANDVQHAWWVPEFGFKKDAIPGFINESWVKIEKAGTYRGQCAELCGANHGYMPVVVIAKEEAEFNEWLQQQKGAIATKQAASNKEWTQAELMKDGEETYNKVCAACHQVNGQGIAGVFPKIAGSPIATGNIKDHVNIVLNGKTGTAMQAFGSQLTDAEIAAVVTYQRNAWGNATGDVIQPADIKAAREQ